MMAPTEWALGSRLNHWKVRFPRGDPFSFSDDDFRPKFPLSTIWTSCAFYAIWKYGALEMSWELQTSFDFIDSRRSQPTQPLSFNRHYIFVPFSNGIPVDSENIKLWNISYVKLEPWSMLHLTKNQLEKKINCSETVKTKLFFQIVSVCVIIIFYEYDKLLHRLLHVLLVPIQLLQFLVTLWRDTLHSHELPASNDIRPHRFYFFYSSRIKVKQVQKPIKYLFEKLQIYHNYTHHYCTTGLLDLMQRYFNLGIIHGPSLHFKDKLSELPFKCDYWPVLVAKQVFWILTKCWNVRSIF